MTASKDIIPQLTLTALTEPLGLYLHIPFCQSRCAYCSFTSTTNLALKKDVLAKIKLQMMQWGKALNKPILNTMYLGGGTPSLLTIDELRNLTLAINNSFDLTTIEEATIEVNPGTVDLNWLEQARHLGWNRISFGIQTLDDHLLTNLGRSHSAQTALEAIALAHQAGFRCISSDLMIGIPGQNLNRVLKDVNTLVNNHITHMSIYMLDLDKNCPLRTAVTNGKLTLPSEDDVADTFAMLQQELPRLGLLPYEISNYAHSGQESKHNSRYWQRLPYLGLGPSAASHIDVWRWTENDQINNWLKHDNKIVIQQLEDSEALAEIPLLGFRMCRGVNWDQLRNQSKKVNLEHLVDHWETKLLPLINHGLVVKNGPMMHFTTRGILLSNAVLQIFV